MLKKIFSKLKIKDLKRIKSFSLLIIPNGSGVESKTHHISAVKAYIIIGIYSLIVFLLGFFIINLTPIKGIIFFDGTNLSPIEKRLINELNLKMTNLTEELKNLKSTNQDLQKAMMLEDSVQIDTLPVKINKSHRKKKIPLGGDAFAAFQEIFQNYHASSQKIFYFIRPIIGFISRGFNPIIGHMGIDIVAKTGTPIAAAASGYVVFSDYTVKDGYMLIINHSDGYVTVYKHCSVLLKKQRELVTGGEVIALSGNSGEITTGPHLHFEIWKDGRPVDPQKLFLNN